MDLGSHALDLFDFLLGPLADVRGSAARVTRGKVEDVVVMTFRTGAGALGSASWNFAGATKNDVIEIDGSKARLVMGCFGDDPVRLESPDGKVEQFDLPNPPHIQQPLIQSIVDELAGRAPAGSCPSAGESAARTSRVMDEVLEGFYGTRADEFWTAPAGGA
jgi:1,5-anhydro-D-fructose reductase (1,5-anhydro-D-mannitol-forming)